MVMDKENTNTRGGNKKKRFNGKKTTFRHIMTIIQR